MMTVEEFLRSRSVVEILPIQSRSIYGTFQTLLDQILPGVRVVPIRSISTNVFCVRVNGVANIIWDESYVANVLDIVEVLLDRGTDAAAATEALVLSVMADLLFDEGLYADAWRAGTIAGVYLPSAIVDKPHLTDSQNNKLTKNMGLSFLFLHEVAHLVRDYDPAEFDKFSSTIKDTITIADAYLDRMSPSERNALLAGEGFIFTDERDVSVLCKDQLIPDELLIEEATADFYALNVTFFSGKGFDSSTAVDVAEFILALRMAMEIIRDIRVRTKRVAVEDREPPPITAAELMRGFVLRHLLFDIVGSLAQTQDELANVSAEFRKRYDRLLHRRLSIFGGLPERLVDFGLGQIKAFRLRMVRAATMLGSKADVTQRFRDSYLRLRGWEAAADPNSLDGLLDIAPFITAL
jgi:hypothetical protein